MTRFIESHRADLDGSEAASSTHYQNSFETRWPLISMLPAIAPMIDGGLDNAEE
jgi:hypothetical protein